MVKTDNIVLSDNKLMFLDPIACISNGRWDPALFNINQQEFSHPL